VNGVTHGKLLADKLCGASRCELQKVPEVVELKVEYGLDLILIAISACRVKTG
jgi:hypothetical protein